MSLILNYNIGLGNELNMYSLYWTLKDMGIDVKFDDPNEAKARYYSQKDAVHHLTLQDLDVDEFEICTREEKEKYLDSKPDIISKVRRKLCGTHGKIIKEEDVKSLDQLIEGYVVGNFPVYWTYKSIPRLKSHIRFKTPIGGGNARNNEIAKEILSNKSVSIHFRRTDYLWAQNSSLNIANDDYYDKAIGFIDKKIGKDTKYYVFSDDKEYIQKKYDPEKFVVVDWNDGEDGIWDFWLMSLCKNNICANSSFSTWASLLNDNEDKIMIRPIRKDAPKWYYDSLVEMGYDLIEV